MSLFGRILRSSCPSNLGWVTYNKYKAVKSNFPVWEGDSPIFFEGKSGQFPSLFSGRPYSVDRYDPLRETRSGWAATDTDPPYERL
jgi:hypothetical protein